MTLLWLPDGKPLSKKRRCTLVWELKSTVITTSGFHDDWPANKNILKKRNLVNNEDYWRAFTHLLRASQCVSSPTTWMCVSGFYDDWPANKNILKMKFSQ